MARQLYSTLLLSMFAAGETTEITVPEGSIAVVRDIVAVVFGSPAGSACEVRVGSGQEFLMLWEPTEADSTFHTEMRQVVNPLELIRGVAQGPSTFSLRVSGYLLSAS